MDMNALNENYAAQREDGTWGIANDYTGKSRYSGKGFPTREAAEQSLNLPKSLNGYPVVDIAPRGSRPNRWVVLVDRGAGSYQRWVVATWGPDCGDEWYLGAYLDDLEEASQVFKHKAGAA